MPRVRVSDTERPSGPWARLWSVVGGPLLTLATLIVLRALATTSWSVPSPAVILLIPVIYSAFAGGLGSGLVSAALCVASALFSSPPGRSLTNPDELQRVLSIGVATPAVALLVAWLRRREHRRSMAQGALRAGERYWNLVDDIDGIVWEADPVTLSFSFVSRRATELVGYPPERWLAELDFWANRIHADDRERARVARLAAVQRGEDHTLDYRMITADGRTVLLRDRASVVKDPRGRPILLRGVMTDIGASVRAEEALRSSEARKGAVVDGAPDGIVIVDHAGNITEFNPAAERMFHLRRADVIGRSMADLIIPPGLRAQHREGFARHLATGETRMLDRRVELAAVRADGTEFPIELSVNRVPSSDPPVFTGFLRDITERKKVEDDLRGTLSLLAATLESTTDGILVVDPEGRILSSNRKFATMWRIPQTVLDSHDDAQAIAFVLSQLRDPEAFVSKVRELYAQPEAESFDVLEFNDGRVFERYSMPRRLEGRSVGRVWSFRDVTERRRSETALRVSEEQLRHAQRMDAIGRLAGGVAHDFNNLLTVILGYTDQLRAQPGVAADDALGIAVDEIRGAAERAAVLTRQLLTFSRKQFQEPKELDLNATVSNTAELLRRLIGEHIALEVRLDPELGRVLTDENQIQQVIMNLAINARDAMPDGGHLTLTTTNADLDDTYARSHLPLAPGRYALLMVSDTGVGMTPETRERAFEPFFTTKEPGKGTGLGLAMVYGIIKQSEGYIWLYSEPGHGTVFKIYLPRLDAPTMPGEETLAAAPSPSGSETVLLVEDEEMLRGLLKALLEELGYRVLAAVSGEEALEMVAGNREPIDLMVTDVVMPGMGGPELADRIAPLHPGLRVLYISGYTDDTVFHHRLRKGMTSFLQKPFTTDAFARKIRDVLDTAKVG